MALSIIQSRLRKMDDTTLLKKREKVGESAFWEELYRRYGQYLISIISYKYPDFRDVAEDIIQETFLRMAFENLSQINNLKAFLVTTAAHICIDKHRHRSAKKRSDLATIALDAEIGGGDDSDDSFLEITENTDSDNPEELTIEQMKIEEYRKILSMLPEECQKVLLMSAEGLKYKEIAKEMGLPIGTVGTKLLRCRERLKKILEQIEVEEAAQEEEETHPDTGAYGKRKPDGLQ